jgi:hypothetical protein
MQHQHALLFWALEANKAHRRPLNRLADRFSIRRIVRWCGGSNDRYVHLLLAPATRRIKLLTRQRLFKDGQKTGALSKMYSSALICLGSVDWPGVVSHSAVKLN